MAMSITYHAEDAVGNVTEKMVMVHLADTTPQPYEPGYVRFISKEYEDTLEENSIWRSAEYAETLAEVLNNKMCIRDRWNRRGNNGGLCRWKCYENSACFGRASLYSGRRYEAGGDV